MAFQKQNDFKVVGTLTNAEVRCDTSKQNGQKFVSAKATVQSVVNGATYEYEVSFYSYELKQDGNVSALYTSYCKMEELIGKKVEITGSIRENRFFASKANEMVSKQELAGRFIKGVSASTADEGTWLLSGVLLKDVEEKTNKNEEVYRYDVTFGQANYQENMMTIFRLNVDPTNRPILKALSGFNIGDTFMLKGNLAFVVEVVTKSSDDQGGFGEPIVKTYTNRQKNFFITGGSGKITDDTAYDVEFVQNLIAAYKENDAKIAAAAASKAPAPVESTPTVTKKQVALI